jgi:hypothetical protein
MIATNEITEPWTDNLPSEETPLTVEEAINITEGIRGCGMADLTGDDLAAFTEIALTIWKRSHPEQDTMAFVQAAGELAMLAMCVHTGKMPVPAGIALAVEAPGILFMDEIRPYDGECIVPQQLAVFNLLAHGPPLALDPMLDIDLKVVAALDKIAPPKATRPPWFDASNRHQRQFRAKPMRPHRRNHGRRR